jgi:hypothetical protein
MATKKARKGGSVSTQAGPVSVRVKPSPIGSIGYRGEHSPGKPATKGTIKVPMAGCGRGGKKGY